MKKIIEVDSKTEGLEKLLGEQVTFFCVNYIYSGELVGVNDKYVLLHDPKIVYETGAFNDPAWKDAQSLPNECCVMLQSIESFMILKPFLSK